VLAVLERFNVPSSLYRTVNEVMQDPQLEHRSAFSEVHDQGGAFKALNPPFRLSQSASEAVPFVAAKGEHTVSVLEEAGLTESEIEQAMRR
jgi:crotonobetainyl-CoA:carnitine CoA-transferase CaiB-like acyl-CoA transferase